jgi:hypothetical protein
MLFGPFRERGGPGAEVAVEEVPLSAAEVVAAGVFWSLPLDQLGFEKREIVHELELRGKLVRELAHHGRHFEIEEGIEAQGLFHHRLAAAVLPEGAFVEGAWWSFHPQLETGEILRLELQERRQVLRQLEPGKRIGQGGDPVCGRGRAPARAGRRPTGPPQPCLSMTWRTTV